MPHSAQKPNSTNDRFQKQFRKTYLCKFISKYSHCNLGAECKFAHSQGELNAVPDLAKTSLCFGFRRGSCDKGVNCKFAHGLSELRSTPAFRGKHPTHEAAALSNRGSHLAFQATAEAAVPAMSGSQRWDNDHAQGSGSGDGLWEGV
mmetsp:Transcript_25573/g.64941  ORF Transcript_25573/g.64941 Transcript_25573/m.64941 type:complete len:147 (-) Transcript_25573:341-781(-)